MNYSYSSYGPFGAVDSTTAMILTLYFGIILVIGVLGLISYIIKGIAMQCMAKREGITHSWLAFIPVGRAYLQGELSGSILFKKRTIKDPGLWLILLPVIGGTIIGGFYVIMLFVIVAAAMAHDQSQAASNMLVTAVVLFMVVYVILLLIYQAFLMTLRVLVNYHILRKFSTSTLAIMHAVLGILIPMYETFALFIHRNRPYNADITQPFE